MPLLGLGLYSPGNSHLDMVDLLIIDFGLYEEQQYDGFFENNQSSILSTHSSTCHSVTPQFKATTLKRPEIKR